MTTGLCEGCGAQCPPGARFCPSCGRPQRPAAEAETRRVVTALFFDVVGSTSLGERLDPEDFQAVVGEGVDRMVAAAEAFGGSPRTPSGDGGLVLFGAPVAHEADAERAVRAALRIVEEMAAYGDEVRAHWGITGFGVRVGVETGVVVLGALGGAGGTSAMGDTLNTAARLESAAPPGQVLVGDRTHREVAQLFEWDGPVALALKGKAEPVRAWRALAPIARASRRPGVRAPLIGRDPELAVSHRAVDITLGGGGGVLVIRGRAGIGKTRMLEEAAGRFTAGGGRWLEGRAASYGESLALHPFAEMLAGIPGAADALSAPADVPTPLALERTFARVSELLRGLAGAAPVALALDDLHWADASTLTLAERLLELTSDAPVLLVLAGRPEPTHPSAALLRLATAWPGSCLLELAGLDRTDERRLLAKLTEGRDMDPGVRDQLLDRAEGNPFYLEELALSVSDGATSHDGAELPSSIEKLVLGRVDALDPAARGLIAAAAVLGRAFDAATLGRMGPRPDLAPLVAADLVVAAGEGRYAFRHPLIQEAIYGGLLRGRRQELHRAAAQALSGRPPAVLARHHALGGQDAEAFVAYLAAAGGAERQGGLAEARAHAEAALDTATRLRLEDTDPGVMEGLRIAAISAWYAVDTERAQSFGKRLLAASRAAGDLRAELDALTLMANFARMADYSQVIPGYEAAVAIAERLGDREALVLLLARMAITQVALLDLAGATATSARAREVAAEAGTPVATGAALDAEKLIALQLGEVDRLEEIVEQLLDLVRPGAEGTPDTYALLRYQYTLLEGAFAPLARGDLDGARLLVDAALAENRRTGMTGVEVPILDGYTWIARAAGDPTKAVDAARTALSSAERSGSSEWLGWCCASLGAVLLEDGAPEEAARVLAAGVDAATAAGAALQSLRCSALLAEAQVGRDDDAAARIAAGRALELHDRATAPEGAALLFVGDTLLALARALHALGERGTAERVSAPVVAAARRTGWWLPAHPVS